MVKVFGRRHPQESTIFYKEYRLYVPHLLMEQEHVMCRTSMSHTKSRLFQSVSVSPSIILYSMFSSNASERMIHPFPSFETKYKKSNKKLYDIFTILHHIFPFLTYTISFMYILYFELPKKDRGCYYK